MKKTFDIWTDGACAVSEGIGGWAYMISNSETVQISQHSGSARNTTNNSMELEAVKQALQDPLVENATVNIHTDSEGVINWINGSWRINKSHIAQYVLEIKALSTKRNITMEFTKVKGHSTDIANILVDNLATEAVKAEKLK